MNIPALTLILLTCLSLRGCALASPLSDPPPGNHPASTSQQALDLLQHTPLPDSSAFWPNIKLALFIANLKANLITPLKIYQGSNTNFCGYAALSYRPLQDDPWPIPAFC